jgi:hypothetical protein
MKERLTMSMHILQDYRGQTFDKAVSGYLRGKLLVSGYEPRTDAGDRFWWGVLENTDGTKAVACGWVSNFIDGGWGYDIERASAWENRELPNPPLNVRKAIVKHSLSVKGVNEPGLTDPGFATTMLKDLTTNLLSSLKAGGEKYAVDALASLQSTVVSVIAEFIRGGEKITFPELVLDACTDYLDAKSASVFARFHRFKTITLTSSQAAKVAPFLDKFDFDNLRSKFPELVPAPHQEAYKLSKEA